jgi:hypothetical protein
MPMKAFFIEGKNKPGELARIAEAIAQKGINITSIAAGTCGEAGSIAVMTNDEAGTRAALSGAGLTFREIEACSTTLEDRPGALAEAAGKLGQAGINIDAVLQIGTSEGKTTIALLTSDPARTRELLGSAVAAR